MKKIEIKKKGKLNISQAVRKSLFFGFLIIVANWINEKIVTSLTAKIFSSYDAISDEYKKSFTNKTISKIGLSSGKRLLIKNKIQKAIETGFFYNTFLSLVNLLVSVSARAYGVVLFMYGFFASSAGLIKTYVSPTFDDDYFLIYQGVVLVLVSIPLLFVKKSFGQLIASGKITGFIIRDVVGIKRERVVRPVIQENTVVPMLIGLLLGVSSLFVSPIYALSFVLILVYVCIVFCYPEFGVMMLSATFPFLSIEIICAEILLLFLSFFFKAIRGKRSVTFGTLEFCIFLFSLLLLFGGIFSVSPMTSIKTSLAYILLVSSYFLVVNLIKNYAMLKRMLAFVSISFFFCTAYGIARIVMGFINHPVNVLQARATVIDSTFGDAEFFAEYLIALIPLVLSFMIVEKGFKNKGRIAFVVLFGICSLVFTWSKTAFLAFALTILIYFIIINKKSVTVYIFAAFFMPIIYSFLPTVLQNGLSDFFDMSDFVSMFSSSVWKEAWDTLGKYSFTGVGVGKSAFDAVYNYGSNSVSLYLHLLFEIGVLGLVVFASIIFFAISKSFSRFKNSENRRLKVIASASLCGAFAMLLKGFTGYTWYNYRVFLLFWLLISIVSSSANLCSDKDKYKVNEDEIYSGGKNDKAEIEIQV